jgi:hypothetical protein
MLMNVLLVLTTVTIMLHVIIQMVHLNVVAMTDIQGMVQAVKVSGL